MQTLPTQTVVNTHVVRALMTLRGHTRQSLSVAAGVREDNLRAWLASSDSSELCLARKNQILVLRTLGIDGLKPRTDTVHLWHLDESSRAARTQGMDALSIAISAFGPAEVIHFGREQDAMFGFSENVYFGLRFSAFRVVLRVKPGFLREVKFSPSALKDLAWAEVNPVCMLPEHRFAQIAKADVTSQEFEDFASGAVELQKWENLHLLAREHHITAEQIARWMVGEVTRREAATSLTFNDAEDEMLLEHQAEPTQVKPIPAAAEAPAPMPAATAPRPEPRAEPTPAPKASAAPATPAAPATEESSNVIDTGLFTRRRQQG